MYDPHARLRHRSCFEVRRDKANADPNTDPFLSAARTSVDWIVQKERRYASSPLIDDIAAQGTFPLMWDYAMPPDYTGGPYDDDRWPALACAHTKACHEAGAVWVLEYDEPDYSREQLRWHTTVCLERISETACEVGIESVLRTRDGASEELPETISAPALVREILELPGLGAFKGETRLSTTPIKLSCDTFACFVEELTCPARTLPLVLFTTGYAATMPDAAKQLARRALGCANVYVLNWSDESLRAQLFELFEPGTPAGQYACPRESCRMYLGGLDLSDPNHSRNHESFSRQDMARKTPAHFAESLARRFIPDEPIRDIASISC